ncbi:DUF4013 domain-containing protein [uncultured Methanobrevibacter sp.]|uniref:DUF4013 domain-containing protein n=1 Tax=uncultured Methanobrevibacter sp. TaxID=253161 RepID=UPI0025D073E3|nr:DUF4013 domain-containing protein [uncultured Methanobrevibacter sp.]
MEIMEIIKEAMVFPSKDIVKLAVYIALSVVSVLLGAFGIIYLAIGVASQSFWIIIGLIAFIAALILGFITTGYIVSIIRSGIEHEESAPQFMWKENLVTGIKFVVLNIVYFIIPAIVVLILGWVTNLFGMASIMFTRMMYASMAAPANATVTIADVVPQSMIISFGNSLIIVGIVAFILFVIFGFLEIMGQCRLAKTDSLGYAVNIPEAFKDIGRIGFGKVIGLTVLIFVIILVINCIISGLNAYIAGFSILSIIVTPYLSFFAARASGLLYSDIA